MSNLLIKQIKIYIKFIAGNSQVSRLDRLPAADREIDFNGNQF